jgi:hypothetical protein
MKKLRTLAAQPRYPADAPATGVWSNTLNLPRAGSRVQSVAARYQRLTTGDASSWGSWLRRATRRLVDNVEQGDGEGR